MDAGSSDVAVMIHGLQILAIMLVAKTMSLALSHALEMPGKLRLGEQEYRMGQQIYYPGFTIGGAGEPTSIVVLLALVIVTGNDGVAFWLNLASLVALAAMHGVYWLFVDPVNNFWVRDIPLSRLSGDFARSCLRAPRRAVHRGECGQGHRTRRCGLSRGRQRKVFATGL